ncbi:MAG: 1-aminocyclopropane-carboxylate deaminase [Polyangiaceae bacterium]|jgi:1-aminocyclopropane-1-carboxylate deaminase/D-cysteine desulfhydrase-like pyridoxal-dependent ACC family enzyme|nr:1-aminocyclopropane-carboxylate deaminase [Polyangiaceae bacterium]
MSALFGFFPALAGRVHHAVLAELPTRVEQADGVLRGADIWLKRDDTSSPVYGGTKLRLLEHLLGAARAAGATRVYSTGAVGSNFAEATALHAPRVALAPGAICFPQPLTDEAARSHRVVQARAQVMEIPHWSLLLLATERVRRSDPGACVLSQVSFDAESLFGYVAAGLELALQIEAKECPSPARVVLPIGSAATSAGLLAGLSLARKMGLLRSAITVCAVRIAAWPLSRRGRVLSLATTSLSWLSRLTGEPRLALPKGDLLPLELVTDQLGVGYPHATPEGSRARHVFADAGYPILDDTYSAKAAAHVLATAQGAGPVLLWCTKSSAGTPLD